jgi:hypothetical protein
MNNKAILDQCSFQRQHLSLLVDDIPDDRMCDQPGAVVNHPAWQLGHLAVATDRFVAAMGGSSTVDESWLTKFKPGSVPQPDRNVYPSKAELLRVLDDRRTALIQIISRATDEDMAKPHSIARLAGMLPTRGHLALFGPLYHESTHLGQLGSWRKAAGMCQALSKLG